MSILWANRQGKPLDNRTPLRDPRVLWGFNSLDEQNINRLARDMFEEKAGKGGRDKSAEWEKAKGKALEWFQANDPGLLDRYSMRNNTMPEASTEFVRKMTEFVEDAEPQAAAQTVPETPVQPSDALVNARQDWERDQAEAEQGKGSIHFDPTGNGIRDAALYGNKATDDYVRRFVPSLKRQAKLEALEIGESGNAHLKRFAGKVPALGDPKAMFEYYKGKLS